MKTIRALRQERGWTQFDLALAVGVQPQTVYLWESGRRQPQVVQMRKLGQVFGICSDEIDLTPGEDTYRAPARGRQADHTARQSAESRLRVDRAIYRSPDDPGSSRESPDA